ncbi:MAG: sulfatase family protein [Puniceicoccales bacterium]
MGKPYNFIILVGEDAGRALGCYGDVDADTPNLDRLASEGCRFDNAFTTSPVCSPSRSAMVTGMYPWSLGTHQHRSKLINPPRILTHELRDAGYYVNWANKTDFNFTPPEDFADATEEWIEALETESLPDQPFFLFHNFTVTHGSTMWGPGEQRFGAHNKERVAKEHLLEPHQRVDPATVYVPSYLPDEPEVRDNIARFYEGQSIGDAEIGRVLKALDRSKYRDNTVVFYFTDHGRGLMREKRWCYDAGLHLSLVVRAPGLTRAGSVDESLVSWVDLAPTILSLANLPIPERYQGQVFMGPEVAPEREYVFGGRDRMDEAYDHCRSVRDKDFLYIKNFFPQIPYSQESWYMEIMETVQVARRMAGEGTLDKHIAKWFEPRKPAEELYDVKADPEMMVNLADDPRYAKKKSELVEVLDRHLERWGDYGNVPEQQLIDHGILEDSLTRMREIAINPPTGRRHSSTPTVVEMPT